jgi:hypothetical protein
MLYSLAGLALRPLQNDVIAKQNAKQNTKSTPYIHVFIMRMGQNGFNDMRSANARLTTSM